MFAPCTLAVVNRGTSIFELTAPGESTLEFIRCLVVSDVVCVAMQGSMIAAGTSHAEMSLLSYSSGAVLLTIRAESPSSWFVDDYGMGVCFTADGGRVLASETSTRSLSMYSVHDGSLAARLAPELICPGMTDVLIAPNGEIIVANQRNVSVFNAESGQLEPGWNVVLAESQQIQPVPLANPDPRLHLS